VTAADRPTPGPAADPMRGRPVGMSDLALAASVAVTAAAMIATPLQQRGRRAGMSVAVVGALCGWVAAASSRRWGARRAVTALGVVAGATIAVEKVGTVTGVPFGRYHYTGELRPQLAGVPVTVPMAWFAMAVPAREAARAVLGPRGPGGAAGRAVVGSALLTAWDLFLDPQMTTEDYWRWERPGRYRGIPASNYRGWFLTGLGVLAAVDRLLPARAEERPEAALVGAYAWMAVMSTLGFAAFFGDPLVAAAGGLAMVPVAVQAVRRTRSWPTS
jgi:uncharacterized membrane protein